jgi:AcrR family transcriptional regulator
VSEATNSSARSRLLRAALDEVAERGVRGATTSRIAERAHVNEVTLFRHFSSKSALVAEALRHATEGFGAAAARPSGNVERDLKELALAYWEFVGANRGAMVRLLPELSRDPSLGEAGGALTGKAFGSLLGIFRHHQEAGALAPDEDPENLALAFLGPLMARGLLTDSLGLVAPFDVGRYVAGYLEGHRA